MASTFNVYDENVQALQLAADQRQRPARPLRGPLDAERLGLNDFDKQHKPAKSVLLYNALYNCRQIATMRDTRSMTRIFYLASLNCTADEAFAYFTGSRSRRYAAQRMAAGNGLPPAGNVLYESGLGP